MGALLSFIIRLWCVRRWVHYWALLLLTHQSLIAIQAQGFLHSSLCLTSGCCDGQKQMTPGPLCLTWAQSKEQWLWIIFPSATISCRGGEERRAWRKWCHKGRQYFYRRKNDEVSLGVIAMDGLAVAWWWTIACTWGKAAWWSGSCFSISQHRFKWFKRKYNCRIVCSYFCSSRSSVISYGTHWIWQCPTGNPVIDITLMDIFSNPVTQLVDPIEICGRI